MRLLSFMSAMVVVSMLVGAANSDDGNPSNVSPKESDEASGIRITEIASQPVGIQFPGFFVKPGGDVDKPDPKFWDLKINWRTGQTVVIPYGGTIHGYKLFPLKKLVRRIWVPRIRDFVTCDIWILTISKDDKEVAQIQMNTLIRFNEPCATLEVKTGEDTWRKTDKLFVDSTFETGGKEFTVTAIGDDTVTIADKDKNETVLEK